MYIPKQRKGVCTFVTKEITENLPKKRGKAKKRLTDPGESL